jgi:hypothetical protein
LSSFGKSGPVWWLQRGTVAVTVTQDCLDFDCRRLTLQERELVLEADISSAARSYRRPRRPVSNEL